MVVRGPDGSVVSVDGVVVDVTDRRRAQDAWLEMERRLLHAQKLESLGVLAGGIAHDFNNLLTAILGNLELGLGRIGNDDAAAEYFRQAIQASRRAADLTRQMLAYSGRGRFVFSRLDLNDLVRENAGLFRASVSRSVTLDLQLAESLPAIQADPGQVQQVVMNLITNASEAIGENPGVVTLITAQRTFSAEELASSRVAEKAGPGPFVCLEVRDTGCGMDEETQQRLFDPFFTTKFTGRGLGLSALQGIMHGHRGAVLLESELGRGTTIRALFPVAAATQTAPEEEPKPAPPPSAPRAASRRAVLVVDDEAPVRELAEKLVLGLGYDAMSADGGESALALLAANPERIGCVLLDLTMPGMDGVSTLKQIRRVRSDVPVILCSGFSEADATLRFVSGELAGFLQKPYGLRELRDALEGLLPPPSVPPEGLARADAP
jgi:signal transduction histidine kinase/CheY-like chemotaxis protein